MHPLERIRQKAKTAGKTIVLPESMDPRMLHAADKALKDGIASILFLGEPDSIRDLAHKEGADIEKATILNHVREKDFSPYCSAYFEKRKAKGVTEEQAEKIMKDPLFYGAMMVREGRVDGMVAGAVNTTANVLRASIQIIGTMPGVKTVSSSFIMVVPNCEYGNHGTFMYADCGVVPNPTAEQLADIAVSTVALARNLLEGDPVVAMLAFSTKGSASDPSLDKIIEATRILKEVRKVEFPVDGELQGDAAIIPHIGAKKAPGSPVAGKANILIFPDLNAGNIAYKLTERLARAEAYGPLLQGVAKPVNDLSRGCKAEDILQTIAITAVEAL